MRIDGEYDNGAAFISIEPVPKEYYEVEEWHQASYSAKEPDSRFDEIPA
ncbi:MAG: hypothetical protein FWG48_05670 [Oscillospiraceae bacterium]|nr:hypothetical protein [Oscillospiraceae bacterium]